MEIHSILLWSQTLLFLQCLPAPADAFLQKWERDLSTRFLFVPLRTFINMLFLCNFPRRFARCRDTRAAAAGYRQITYQR